jgi:predicted ribosome quality control (RQC) complex YloA/Tae2 family protein
MAEIEVDFTKSAQQNADEYYKKSKKLILKKEGAEKAVAELKQRLEKAEKESAGAAKARRIIKVAKKEWYEKFHWFFTSNEMLVIAGRDAHQNEMLNSKHFEDNDLFFHANIFGAPVTILKNGIHANLETKQEVAQFAASYSSAWKQGLHTIDIYAMKREQVSKSTGKGSLGTGSFLLSGERDWYRDVRLALIMYVKDGRLCTIPYLTFERIKATVKEHAMIELGNDRKSEAAKKISKRLGYDDIDSIIQALPAGEFKIS